MSRSAQSQSPPRRRATPITQPPSAPFPSHASSFSTASNARGPEEGTPTTLAEIGDDILGSILSRLPARSFACAACVSRTWTSVCSRILSRPKMCSALSVNPSLPMAVDEIVDKVLAGPIRPHFAILYVNDKMYLENAHQLVARKLGSSTPMITVNGAGIMGRDVKSGRFWEIMGVPGDSTSAFEHVLNRGVLLTVGYLPGLKVQIVHVRHSKEDQLKAERFVRNVRDCSVAISGSSSPAAIIMFGDMSCRMKPIVHLLCNSLAEEAIVVGNETTRFMLSGQWLPDIEVAAFVFARDRCKSNELGKIQFHLAFASGVAEVGPNFKAVSVRTRTKDNSTWLTARREGFVEILDGIQILGDLAALPSDLYIGVTKKRNVCVVGSEKVKSVSYLDYHLSLGGDEQNLYVHDVDIKTGDPFQFYTPDPVHALDSIAQVSKNLRKLKEDVYITGSRPGAAKEVIGGFIFSCCGRGDNFFDDQNIDSSPIMKNFPAIPCAGVFCGGEIARGPLMASISEEGSDMEDGSSMRSYMHVYGSAYLLLSYDPQPM